MRTVVFLQEAHFRAANAVHPPLHWRECSYEHPAVYDRIDGNQDEWLCDCIRGQWSCWLAFAAVSICDGENVDERALPDGANCGLAPLPSCDKVIAEIDEFAKTAQRCEGDEACAVDFDWNCDGELDRYSVSFGLQPSQAEGLLEVVGCYQAQACDPFSVSRSTEARCVDGTCQLQ